MLVVSLPNSRRDDCTLASTAIRIFAMPWHAARYVDKGPVWISDASRPWPGREALLNVDALIVQEGKNTSREEFAFGEHGVI